MAYIAVQGCSFNITSPAGAVAFASATASNAPSTDVLVNNRGVFFDKVSCLVSGVTITSPQAGTTGTGTLVSDTIDISGTGSNMTDASSSNTVLMGDSGTKTCTFTFTTTTTPPSTVDIPLPLKAEITDAGQTDADLT